MSNATLNAPKAAAMAAKPTSQIVNKVGGEVISTTTDYDKFKHITGNRTIRKGHVARLVKAMQKKDLGTPIIVNEKMEIVDGQHRLEARRQLGLPVPYIVRKGYRLQDVQELNSNTLRFNIDDFLDGYVELGLEDYITLRDFRNQYKLKFDIALMLLSDTAYRPGGAGGKGNTSDFKQGKFKVQDLEKANRFAGWLMDLRPLLPHMFDKRVAFQAACIRMFHNPGYDHQEMLRKIEQKQKVSGSVELQDSLNARNFLEALTNLYNYRNREVVVRF